MQEDELFKKQVQLLKIDHIKYHIFLCCDQTNPKCCQYDEGMVSWEYLKKRLAQLQPNLNFTIYRTKANCLRVCQKGPIAVIYPEGIWYHSCTPEVLERIISEHFLNDKPVEEYIFVRNEIITSSAIEK